MRNIHGIIGARRTTTTLRRSALGPRERSGHLASIRALSASSRAMKSASSLSSVPPRQCLRECVSSPDSGQMRRKHRGLPPEQRHGQVPSVSRIWRMLRQRGSSPPSPTSGRGAPGSVRGEPAQPVLAVRRDPLALCRGDGGRVCNFPGRSLQTGRGLDGDEDATPQGPGGVPG
jgi:hypothetical protein